MENVPRCIDVYSAESRTEILSHLTQDSGICFRGAIGAEDVKKVIGESMAVIHTESFDKSIAKSIRYSVSTKIADSLASGTPLIAYGPADVASIEYLKENDAALVITSEDELKERLKAFFEDESLRKKIRENALHLARANHIKSGGGVSLKDILSRI